AALYAVFPSAGTRPIFPELLREGYEPHDVDELWMQFSDHADTFIDVSAQEDRKIAALLCHRSQVGPEVGDMVRKWDAEDGQKHGYAYGESFRVIRLKQPAASEGVQEAMQESPAAALD
ncbi:MAG: hypothetical protein OIN84_04840, partial [Candidatus Methanoperedens sp.]|nr:hypothetical protein [Candidatus Methanoperedens sp.]